jgi:hypothetical protein
MSKYPVISSRNSRLPRRPMRMQKAAARPSDAELRASAGRILDMLQQLVMVRPEMIIPLEEIVRGVLSNVFIHVEHQPADAKERRLRGRAPLPPVPLSELPHLKALLEEPVPPAAAIGKQGALRRGAKKKRRQFKTPR